MKNLNLNYYYLMIFMGDVIIVTPLTRFIRYNQLQYVAWVSCDRILSCNFFNIVKNSYIERGSAVQNVMQLSYPDD